MGGLEGASQWDSPLTELASPLGEEERESAFSVFSELEPFWLWRSAVDAVLDAADWKTPSGPKNEIKNETKIIIQNDALETSP